MSTHFKKMYAKIKTIEPEPNPDPYPYPNQCCQANRTVNANTTVINTGRMNLLPPLIAVRAPKNAPPITDTPMHNPTM
ncbi:hypothetical protein EMIT047CA2_90241 [Pseudomonas soli]